MGAGCYYTHKCNKERAAWIELDLPDDSLDAQDALDYVYEDLEQILYDNGWNKDSKCEFYNGLFNLFLDSTYYGDGIVIRIEPKTDEDNTYYLALSNHHRSENKILKAIAKSGYKMRIATSGYTSAELNFK